MSIGSCRLSSFNASLSREYGHRQSQETTKLLFSELRFWGFFLAVFGLYLVLRHRAQNGMLLIASYVFYAAWDWRFLGLMIFSTMVSYWAALRMEGATEPQRRRLLWITLTVCLGILAVFKYFGFFSESMATLLTAFGVTAEPLFLDIILPVGISFYTFQTLSYTIDVYRREIRPCDDVMDFALYVAFFPALVAGPIERAKNLLPQIKAPRSVTWQAIARGAELCLLGLIKKTVIADGISPSVDAVYGAPDPGAAAILIATWLFAFQIYCDFSGYTDIARGVSRMMGFRLVRNFQQPYFATNPAEFWRRWHMSLSGWLRDYLYISLGGNRGGRARTCRNLFLTMLLGGLWHGAAWNFVLWGAYQGVILIVHRLLFWRPDRAGGQPLLVMHWIRIFLFFQVTCYGWLLFRADSFDQIVSFTGKLLHLRIGDFAVLDMPSLPVPAICGMIFLLAYDIAAEFSRSAQFHVRWPVMLRGGFYASMIYLLAFGATTETASFIYFQF